MPLPVWPPQRLLSRQVGWDRTEVAVPQIHVELVEHTPEAPLSGIGRYTRELHRYLAPHVSVRMTTQTGPPLSKLLSFFHHLPLGVAGHRPGNLVHFVEDLGCSQMLWRPVRPAIATSHDLGMLVWPPEARMHPPIDRMMWYLSYLGLRRMDAVITVSEFSRRMIVKRLGIPAQRVFAVHSGIDTSRFRPVADARAQVLDRYHLPNAADDRYLIFVGTEIPRKNLTTLLNALSLLPPNVRLLKVGSAGHWRFRAATDRAIVELGVSGRVIFLNEVSEDDLVLLYNAADVFISCSYLEGFCLPILEAMACGAPVVCSNTSALPEVAGDAAILLRPSDARGFAAAVTAILASDELRAKMVSRGRERADMFSWAKTAEGVLAVYERIVSARPA